MTFTSAWGEQSLGERHMVYQSPRHRLTLRRLSRIHGLPLPNHPLPIHVPPGFGARFIDYGRYSAGVQDDRTSG